jgi:hypothetical protein
MSKLTTTLCLTVAVLLGSAGISWSADTISNETKNRFRVYLNDFDREFNKVPLGETFFPDRNGYEYQKKIVAAPNRRIPFYAKIFVFDKLWTGGIGIGIVNQRVAIKLQNMSVSNKTTCMDSIVYTIETLQSRGLKGWKKTWREDYQVPNYKSVNKGVMAKVTCRMKEGIWMLETTYADLKTINSR